MKQVMMGFWGWQWHQLNHMQTICTSLQTGNHTNTSSLDFYRPHALPDTQPTVSQHIFCALYTIHCTVTARMEKLENPKMSCEIVWKMRYWGKLCCLVNV